MYRVKWFLVFAFVKTELVSLPATSKGYRVISSSSSLHTYFYLGTYRSFHSAHNADFILSVLFIVISSCLSFSPDSAGRYSNFAVLLYRRAKGKAESDTHLKLFK